MEIGETSGCLEIVGGRFTVENELKTIITAQAEQEWDHSSLFKKRFLQVDFQSFYKLDEAETELYLQKKGMPNSFIEKFRKNGFFDFSLGSQFLFHNNYPCTLNDLKEAFRNKRLYKVKCRKCGREFYTDCNSFKCVKWRSCIGAKCLESTIPERTVDYNQSIYKWDVSKSTLQVLDNQLAEIDQISTPLTYYGFQNSLRIAYVSDIHLCHHLKYFDNNKQKMLRTIASDLYSSKENAQIILFNGDVSSDPNLVVEFYSYFMRKHDLDVFRSFKDILFQSKKLKASLSTKERNMINRKIRIEKYISKIKNDLNPFFDFASFENFSKHHFFDKMEPAFLSYKHEKVYQKQHISVQNETILQKLFSLMDIRNNYIKSISRYENYKNSIQKRLEDFENLYGKPIEEIGLNDYRHSYLPNVFVTLGNHEYMGFSNIDSAITFYQNSLTKFGIHFLHNNFISNEKILIYGGTGFAKYDFKYNANTIACCKNFSREDECKETELFERGYQSALSFAKENGLCFLCASHYPISACLNGMYDREAIYFTGHTHNNSLIKAENVVIYADNQIGYRTKKIQFKIATTGLEKNPYIDAPDGLYQTTIKDYLQFYRYLGENIGQGNCLYQKCQDNKAYLYVIKRKGYYGFFILTHSGQSKGISIVDGGKTKRLTSSTDLNWICDNFDIVLHKYLQVLLPFRKMQEQLSEELKTLGFDNDKCGTIHGCIVDIDFYHHIMLNPFENKITLYYSPVYGEVQPLYSIGQLISSIKKNSNSLSSNQLEAIKKNYQKKKKQNDFLLSHFSDKKQMQIEDGTHSDYVFSEMSTVSRSSGMYEVSRRINPLQRLFSNHVLRDFDLALTESKQNAFRKFSYVNRVFMFRGVQYKVVEDDGTEFIVVEEYTEQKYSIPGSKKKATEIVPTGKLKKFSITFLKKTMAGRRAAEAYWLN